MFRCYSYTIIRERINLCLLKLQLLKQSVKIHKIHINGTQIKIHKVHINGTPMYFNELF